MQTDKNTILISGGSSGIGAVLAICLQRAGNTVIVTGRDPEKLKILQAAHPEIEAHICDIRDNGQVEALRDKVADRVNILINNAAILHELSFCDTVDLQLQLDQVDTNLNGMLRMINAFLPALREREHAAIVNVTSALAFVTDAKSPIYSATKAAQHSLSLSLRHQLRGTSVKVFELIPPLTDTPMASHITDIPKLAPEKLAKAFIGGLARDKFEIAPGLSGPARLFSRIAPKFTFSKMNK